MNKTLIAAAIAVAAGSVSAQALARDTINIVGSSTVFPFSTAVAETFGRSGGFKTPKVESTGTGGGMKLFCAGVGVTHPGHHQRLPRHEGLRVRELPGEGREGDHRGQDRLRRHRASPSPRRAPPWT
jgi:hypothetical protein